MNRDLALMLRRPMEVRWPRTSASVVHAVIRWTSDAKTACGIRVPSQASKRCGMLKNCVRCMTALCIVEDWERPRKARKTKTEKLAEWMEGQRISVRGRGVLRPPYRPDWELLAKWHLTELRRARAQARGRTVGYCNRPRYSKHQTGALLAVFHGMKPSECRVVLIPKRRAKRG